MFPTCGDPEATRTNSTHASNASTWGHREEGCTRGGAAAGLGLAGTGQAQDGPWGRRGHPEAVPEVGPHTRHRDRAAMRSLLLGAQVWPIPPCPGPSESLGSPVRASAPARSPRLRGKPVLPQTPPPALTSFGSSLERRGRGGSRECPPGEGGSGEQTRSTCGDSKRHQHSRNTAAKRVSCPAGGHRGW